MSKDLSYLEAIREALTEEMRRDPKVFVLGEDVGPYGGAFGVTQGVFEEFGEMRVVDTPISESAIIGVSIAAAHLRREGDAVARSRRPPRQGRGRGRGHRSPHPDAVR